jgi:hypothetical protein
MEPEYEANLMERIKRQTSVKKLFDFVGRMI